MRVSTKEQAENLSLETQEQSCRAYYARQDLQVDRVFYERGESAKTEERRVLQEMLRYCSDNRSRLRAVVVWKVDRFSRNAEAHLGLRALLRANGVVLMSVNENLGESPSERFMETVFAGAAQYDNDVRAQRTCVGMQAALEKGQWTFQLPVGYVNTQTGVQPDSVSGPILREAFERMASGNHTREQVLRWATKRGLRSRRGRAITPRDFGRILRNPLHAGIIDVMGVQSRTAFSPLVSEPVFNRAQAVMDGRKLPHRNY